MESETKALHAAAIGVAIFFFTIAILGFIPGVTTNVGDLSFAGHHSNAKLFGLFQVSILHNVVHLLFGVAGLIFARRAPRYFLIGCGLIYFAVWVYGIAIDHDSAANIVPVNTADNWLHLFFCFGMMLLGVTLDNRVPVNKTLN